LQKSFRSCGETVALRVLPKNIGDGEIGRTVDTYFTNTPMRDSPAQTGSPAIAMLSFTYWESIGKVPDR